MCAGVKSRCAWLWARWAAYRGAVPGSGLRISMVGCQVGLALAATLTRTLSSMLFGVSTIDVTTLGVVVAIVLVVSALASLFPALRASRFEPVQTLREQ